jgi:photosystem II stability/assembly factor-like uncharacterized protein
MMQSFLTVRRPRWAALSLALSVMGATVLAPEGAQAQAQTPETVVTSGISMRSIGPGSYSGRVSDIAVAIDPLSPPGTRAARTIFVASAAGGVFRSTNGGVTFEPVFDEVRVPSIGAVAVAPSDPRIVYVGTGESNNLRSSSWGKGIYRSNDGGDSWTFIGLRESQHVARIVVHPTSPQTVFVAAMGPLWAEGGERGFYKTTDGGSTWRNTLAVSPQTGVTDIALDPSNPNIIYAATFQRERRSWSFIAGGPESAIWKSTDGGETWTRLSAGLPTGDVGRIGLAVSPSNPNIVWAHIDHDEPGTFRSDDGGATWRRTSNRASTFPWFFGQIRVDPKDPEKIYHLGVSMDMSPDGGATWTTIANGTHADHHAMWIDPFDPDHLIIGNDGGLYFSYDGGRTNDFVVNLPIAQFYTVNVDLREPFYQVYGGTQDNGTWAGPVQVRRSSGIGNDDWVRINGGDGFHVAADPNDPDIVYSESQNGALSRLNLATGDRKNIRPSNPPGIQTRYNWSAPIIISPHDPKTIYFAANVLFRSRDRGDSWEVLGGDLTRALDRDALPIMGFTTAGGFRRHASTADFGNIATISESPLREGLLYVGTDDGLIQVSRDGGATWRKIDSFPGVPELAYVSRVEASAHREGRVYATFDHHRDNDFRPYVLRSDDFGATWVSISANLPEDESVQVIREHPRAENLLFVGTEIGLYVSVDGGARWLPLQNGLPAAPVHDLMIHPKANDLAIGTHGRGIFILHDLAPLERLAQGRTVRIAELFAPANAMIMAPTSGAVSPGQRGYYLPNPPLGAQIRYLVQEAFPAGAQPFLQVQDPAGRLVRALDVDARPGFRTARWDLRHGAPRAIAQSEAGQEVATSPGYEPFEEAVLQQAQAGPPGHTVFPGDYRVVLGYTTANGQTVILGEESIRVLVDPAMRLTDAEHRELYTWRERGAAVVLEAERAIIRAEGARGGLSGAQQQQLDALLVRLRGPATQGGGGGGGGGFGGGGGGGGGAAANAVIQRAASVIAAIGTGYFMPTPEHKATLVNAQNDLQAVLVELNGILPAGR